MFDRALDHRLSFYYQMLQFAREGIPPESYKQLSVYEQRTLAGLISGLALGREERRG